MIIVVVSIVTVGNFSLHMYSECSRQQAEGPKHELHQDHC